VSAIQVVGVAKRFRLYHEKYQSLKERVIHLGRIPFEDFWALRDVDLEIPEGSTFALLGHNGSGKSTLLKCIAGILRPTEGAIHVRGRLAAMLELGAGFHPDLTGRENVYMNAAILGFSEKEIDAKFDDIVAFSELSQFIDQQVKHYSSGMYVRLGFAVAVHMDPEILLVDEVLAVGDEAFQQKCIARVRQFQNEGRTIIIVTHNVDLVPKVCDRAGVLAHGRLIGIDEPEGAIRTLRESMFDGAADPGATSAGPSRAFLAVDLEITSVSVDAPNTSEGSITTTSGAAVRVAYRTRARVASVGVRLSIVDGAGVEVVAIDSRTLGHEMASIDGSGTVTFEIDRLPLAAGDYHATVGFLDAVGNVKVDVVHKPLPFSVAHDGPDTGRVSVPARIVFERVATSVETG